MVTDKQINELFTRQQERHKQITQVINREQKTGYPTGLTHIMEHSMLEKIAGMKGYVENPTAVYRQAALNIGVSFIDQWIPDNPLVMGAEGYEDAEATATTGAEKIIMDGMEINEPEDVCIHMEKHHFPQLQKLIREFNEEDHIRKIGLSEYEQQMETGEEFLKTGYGYIGFPELHYYTYGYENYFSAYALEPEMMEQCFTLESDYALLCNRAAVKAVQRYNLPKLFRLDHDMTDSRGTLVDIKSLERMWFPNLYRALEPIMNTDIRVIWHCDGNCMQMVPLLLETGIQGFQGFQYEDGMDYAKICKMRDKDGQPLFIWAGASVTRTLPFGTPDDVSRELAYLVDNHDKAQLVLSVTSSVTPGVKWENLQALIEGLQYYRNYTGGK